MHQNAVKIKLNDRDKRILNDNKNICTDLHGRGCVLPKSNISDKN